MEIIPAVLTNDATKLNSLLRQIRDSKKYSRAQIDFVDGSFAKNLTIKPTECDLIPYLPLKFDAHLMVAGDNALFWGKTAEAVGFDRVIIQIEKTEEWKGFNCLALDLQTGVETIEPFLGDLRLILLMAVPAGRGGSEFNGLVMDKVRKLVETRAAKGYEYRICVDGGVEQEHVEMLAKMGVDEVAVGAERVLAW